MTPFLLGYLDPGSGSFLFQILIASLLAGFYATRTIWDQLKGFFRKKKGGPSPK